MADQEELPGYLRAPDRTPLYAVYHPAAPLPPNAPTRAWPVVLAPPLFEERKSAYAFLRRLATRLAAAGHAALRFDYRGSGESGGDPARRRWSDLASDLNTARKTVARLTGKRDAVLLGLRAGATVALQEALRSGGEGVVALAPMIKGATQVRLWRMRTKIRSELTKEAAQSGSGAAPAQETAADAALDFDGYPVHPDFFSDVAALDLVRDGSRLSCPGLVVQLSHRAEPAPESTQLVETLGSRARLEALRCEPFWDKLDDVDTGPLEELVVRTVAAW